MSEGLMNTHVHVDTAQGHLQVQGDLSDTTGAELYAAVQTLSVSPATEVVIDLSAVSRLDSLGGAWLSRTAEGVRQQGLTLRLQGAQGHVADFVELIRPTLESPPPPAPRKVGTFEMIGDGAFSALAEGREALSLVVDAIYWTVLAPITGKGLRWRSVIEELARMGVQATLIVILMNVLLGLVIALMSAAQLRQFGAGIFVADLVVIAFTRELAAMMTAIIVAARSGSAIAAELATMVVQEEIDALTSMGLNTSQFLIAPRCWAMLLAMPALTTVAMFAGTLGGMALGVSYLDINAETWLNETLQAVTLQDVLQGLIKSLVFGLAIVFVGCHNGLRVQGGAQGVGQATTRAVVTDVVCIVLLDMAFALFFEFVL